MVVLEFAKIDCCMSQDDTLEPKVCIATRNRVLKDGLGLVSGVELPKRTRKKHKEQIPSNNTQLTGFKRLDSVGAQLDDNVFEPARVSTPTKFPAEFRCSPSPPPFHGWDSNLNTPKSRPSSAPPAVPLFESLNSTPSSEKASLDWDHNETAIELQLSPNDTLVKLPSNPPFSPLRFDSPCSASCYDQESDLLSSPAVAKSPTVDTTAATSALTAAAPVPTAATSVLTAVAPLTTVATSVLAAAASVTTAATPVSTAATSALTAAAPVQTAATSVSTAAAPILTAATSVSAAAASVTTAATPVSAAATVSSTAAAHIPTAAAPIPTAATSLSTAAAPFPTAVTSVSTAAAPTTTAAAFVSTAAAPIPPAATSVSTAVAPISTAAASITTAAPVPTAVPSILTAAAPILTAATTVLTASASSNQSAANTTRMASQETIKRLCICKRAVKRSIQLKTDLSDLNNRTSTYLEQTAMDLRTLMIDLEEATSYLEVTKDPLYDDVKTETEEANGDLLQFIDSINVHIKATRVSSNLTTSSQSTSRSSSPSRLCSDNLKASRVRDRKAKVLTDLKNLSDEYKDMKDEVIDNDSDVLKLYAHFKSLESQFSNTRNKGLKLLEDATSIADANAAKDLDKAVLELEDAQEAAQSFLNSAKLDRGITNLEHVDRAKKDILTKPTFSGDTSKEDDYFTFKKKFEEYVASMNNLTSDDIIQLLKDQCLTGTAKSICSPFDKLAECWAQLNVLYGNLPVILNDFKMQAVNFPSCPSGRNIKPRLDWYVKAKTLLVKTQKFAEENQYTTELYTASTNMHNIIRAKMVYTDANEVNKKFRELTNENGVQKVKECYQKLLEHLNQEIQNASSDLCILGLDKDINQPAKSNQNGNSTSNNNSNKKGENGKKIYTAKQNSGKGHQSQKASDGARSNKKEERTPTPALVQTGDGKKPAYVNCTMCNKKHTHIFYCTEFLQTDVKARLKQTQELRVCFRCLRMDANVDFNDLESWWEQHKNDCRSDFVCDENYCATHKHRVQRHILVCNYHVKANRKKIDDFLSAHKNLPITSNLLHIQPAYSLLPVEDEETPEDVIPDPDGPGLFMMQRVLSPGGKVIHIFFDSGCGSAGITKEAAGLYNSKTVRPGPTLLSVAGGKIVKLEDGEDRIYLDLVDKRRATVIGIVMPSLTSTFPTYDLQQAYCELLDSTNQPDQPQVPDKLGGSPMDIIIGIKYNYLFPVPTIQLPGGLALCKSPIKGIDGKNGVISGPHKAWRQAEESSNFMGAAHYFSSEFRALREHSSTLWASGKEWCAKERDVNEVLEDSYDTLIDAKDVEHTIHHARHIEKQYTDLENIGSESLYRCPAHRNCSDCKDGDSLEISSFKEEVEQSMIEDSVRYDEEQKILCASLPFVQDPVEELVPNKHIAHKVLTGQMKKISKSEDVKNQVLESHKKLADRGYSVKYDDLPIEDKAVLDNLPGEYYLPWRFVFKEGSTSTPVRCVFDASSRTGSGKSLNDCLAKGQNKLEKILSLLLNFRAGKLAFSCDIKMAYNQLKLDLECRRWHKYLWHEDLNPENPVEVRVLCTLIYGVVSSGNQTGEGIAKLAKFCKENYPEFADGADVLTNKTYVDDASDSADNQEELMGKVSGVDHTLTLGSMTVKSYILSGMQPHESVAKEGKYVSILGYQWEPEADRLSLEPKELYFGKSNRGKRPEAVKGDIKSALCTNFTRRTILSKVAGNYDPLGLFTPLTAVFKLDYSELSGKDMGWDDGIPLQYLDTWVRNLQVMQAMQQVTFPRPVITSTNDVTMITSVDASQNLGVACVHLRSELDDGSVKVCLAAAKSKIVQGSTIPRAELKAAVVGSVLSDVVAKNMKGKVTKRLYITDSTIVLNWLNQDTRPMTIAVRNSVVDIRRFTKREDWYHVDTKNNLADLGTRGKASVDQVNEQSSWQNGLPWMYLPVTEMPIKTLQQTQVSKSDEEEIRKELKSTEFHGFVDHNHSAVEDRYMFSNYVVDPTSWPWPKVVRILVYVRRFCYWSFKQKPRKDTLPGLESTAGPITDDEVRLAERYFFLKATREVREFAPKKDYKDVTVEKEGILYYNARILDNTNISDVANVMPDVGPLHFVVPITERYSPVSYSIMLHAHETLARHRNVNTTLLESRQVAFILGGRDMAKEVRKACISCKRHKARLMEVELAKIHENRLTIAPPFYYTQVDLMGPFLARCEHSHRSTVKVWAAVFRDTSCGAVSAHAMSSYSTDSFVSAFIRFSVTRAYPAKIFIDAGSQLMKACNSMELNYTDIKSTLNGKYCVGIEYEVAPTAGHNYQGCVERSIAELKKLFSLTFDGMKLDVLNYETAFSYICNEINNLPICLGSRVSELGNLDLITPSRLLYGRNNRRAPVGACSLESPGRLLKQMDLVYESWWTVWAKEKLVDYIPQPSDFKKTGYQPKVGDICVFLQDRGESINNETWKLGRVTAAHASADGLVRSVTLEYANASESKLRTTRRSVRRVAALFGEDEVFLVDKLNSAAKRADVHHNLVMKQQTKSTNEEIL